MITHRLACWKLVSRRHGHRRSSRNTLASGDQLHRPAIGGQFGTACFPYIALLQPFLSIHPGKSQAHPILTSTSLAHASDLLSPPRSVQREWAASTPPRRRSPAGPPGTPPATSPPTRTPSGTAPPFNSSLLLLPPCSVLVVFSSGIYP
jgi:hypothetical protein